MEQRAFYPKILLAMLLLLSFNSVGGTWQPAGAGAIPVFATELFGEKNRTIITPVDAIYVIDSSISPREFVIEYTLRGGTFGNQLSNSSLTYTQNGGSGQAAIILVAGGGANDSSVTFRVRVLSTLTNNDSFTLDYLIDTEILSNETTDGPTLEVELRDQLGNIEPPGIAGTVARSSDEITLSSSAPAAPIRIDSQSGNKLFSNGAKSALVGSFRVSDNGLATEDDGLTSFAIGSGDGIIWDAKVTVLGEFSSAVNVDIDGDDATADGVRISGCISKSASDITTTSASFIFSLAELISIVGLQCDLEIFVDGVTLISAQKPSLEIYIEYDERGYAHEQLNIQLQSLERDGESQEIRLLLNPNSEFENFLRVSNLGSAAGTFSIRLYNDSGESVSFVMAEIILQGGASSRLISVSELYQRALEIDSSFDAGKGNLRAQFEATFAPLDIQNVVVSSDGTIFKTLN